MYYDGQIHGSYCGLFDPVKMDVFPAYYAIHSFGELYALGSEVKIGSSEEMPVMAATDGNIGKILVVNTARNQIPLELDMPENWEFNTYRELDSVNGLVVKNEIELSKITVSPMKIAIIECKIRK